ICRCLKNSVKSGRIRHGFFEEEHFAAQSGRWRIILEQVQIIQKARGEHRMERISLNIFLEKATRDTAFILLQQVCCSCERMESMHVLYADISQERQSLKRQKTEPIGLNTTMVRAAAGRRQT